MLDGCRVLLIEDEYLLAEDLRGRLEDVGVLVLGPEPSVTRALNRITKEPVINAAILDVNLGGEEGFPVADALAARQVPFLFVCGYQEDIIKNRFPNAIACDKPVNVQRLLAALEALIHPVGERIA